MSDVSKNTDIQVVLENTKGHDKVIGDLHGNRKCLEAVLETLGENDRLFIVGDLTDRGKDSPGVIKLINKHNQEHNNRIVVIRGNHELLCLDTILGLETIALYQTLNLEDDAEKDNAIRTVNHHQNKNGGKWLVELFNKEAEKGKIKIKENINKPGEFTIEYTDNSKVKMIKDFMEGLPYIIHMTGDKKVNFVHADMPVNDEELQRRIKNREGLSEEEKQYSTWAREGDNTIKNKGRTQESIPTFVGHSIVDSPSVQAVRDTTNTYDIDVGAYYTKVSLVVNITTGESSYVGYEGPSDLAHTKKNKNLNRAKYDIDRKLQVLNKLTKFLSELKACDSDPLKINAVFDKWSVNKPEQYFSRTALKEYAINNQVVTSEFLKKVDSQIVIEPLLKSVTEFTMLGTKTKVLISPTHYIVFKNEETIVLYQRKFDEKGKEIAMVDDKIRSGFKVKLDDKNIIKNFSDYNSIKDVSTRLKDLKQTSNFSPDDNVSSQTVISLLQNVGVRDWVQVQGAELRMSGDRVTPLLITPTHRIALKDQKLIISERVFNKKGEEVRTDEKKPPELRETNVDIRDILSPQLIKESVQKLEESKESQRVLLHSYRENRDKVKSKEEPGSERKLKSKRSHRSRDN